MSDSPLATGDICKSSSRQRWLVKFVTIKTAQSEFIRAIAKLIKLPLDDSLDEGDIERFTDADGVNKLATLELRSRTIQR